MAAQSPTLLLLGGGNNERRIKKTSGLKQKQRAAQISFETTRKENIPEKLFSFKR